MIFEEFKNKAEKLHNSKYSYEKNNVNEINSQDYIIITCPIHGEFKQKAYAHLKGQSCQKCARNQKLTTEEFIEKVKKANNSNISFEKTAYVNKMTKVIVTCHEKDENGIEHGDYEVLPPTLLNGCKCPKCSHKHNTNVGRNYELKNTLTEGQIKEKTEQFILKCKERGLAENISFDEFVYNGSLIKSKFICKEHGEFYMSPNNFLSGHSCPKCAKNSRYNKDEIIERLNNLYGEKYSYDIPDNPRYDDYIIVNCIEHGEFKIKLGSLLSGKGCRKCAKNKPMTTSEYVGRCKKIMPENTIFDKTEYINFQTKTLFTCPIHGDFRLYPSQALKGYGCQECNIKSLLEQSVENYLKENNISFEKQKTFDWLVYKKNQKLDFYLPEYKIAIECQGEQHFYDRSDYRIFRHFEYVTDRDLNKYRLCKEHGIGILYLLPNKHIDLSFANDRIGIYNENNVIYSVEELFECIDSLR